MGKIIDKILGRGEKDKPKEPIKPAEINKDLKTLLELEGEERAKALHKHGLI